MKANARILRALAEVCLAFAEEEVANDDRHAELKHDIHEMERAQGRLFLDNQKLGSDLAKVAATLTIAPAATAQAIARELKPQQAADGADRTPIADLKEDQKLPVECASCGFKTEIPCRFGTHFYSERAEIASAAGWGVAVSPGKTIYYFCPDHSAPDVMARALEKRGAA